MINQFQIIFCFIWPFLVFQKAKWEWQNEQRPRNSDSEEEQDEESGNSDSEEEQDEETRNFDLKAKNKIFNIFANVIGSLAISNTEVAKKGDHEELHEELFAGLEVSDGSVNRIRLIDLLGNFTKFLLQKLN